MRRARSDSVSTSAKMPAEATATSTVTRSWCPAPLVCLAPMSPAEAQNLSVGSAHSVGVSPSCHGTPARRSPGADLPQTQPSAPRDLLLSDLRHVTEQDQRAVVVSRQRLQARLWIEVLKRFGMSGLGTMVTFRSPRAAGNLRGFPKPVTTITGSAPSAASATRATMGLPLDGSSSLLRGAMREDRPAAANDGPATFIGGRCPPCCTAVISATMESAISARTLRPDVEPIGA